MDLFLTAGVEVVKLNVPSAIMFKIIANLFYNRLTADQRNHLMPYLQLHHGKINWSKLIKNEILNSSGPVSDEEFNKLEREIDSCLKYGELSPHWGHASTATRSDILYHGCPQ